MTGITRAPFFQEEGAKIRPACSHERRKVEAKEFEPDTDLELVAKYLKMDLKKVIAFCIAGAKSIRDIKTLIEWDKMEKKKKNRKIVDRWGKYF